MEILNVQSALEEMGGDEEIYFEVLDAFLDDAPNLLASIENSLKEHDTEALNRGAHSMKSTSRTIGGLQTGDIAFQLEQLTAAGHPFNESDARSLVNGLRLSYELLLKEIEKLKNK